MSGRIIDLTVTLTNNMPAHKFFPKPVIVPHFGHEEFRQWNLGIPGDQLGGATTFIGMVDYVGTHVDAFFHVRVHLLVLRFAVPDAGRSVWPN